MKLTLAVLAIATTAASAFVTPGRRVIATNNNNAVVVAANDVMFNRMRGQLNAAKQAMFLLTPSVYLVLYFK
jgi:hypothetical protein